VKAGAWITIDSEQRPRPRSFHRAAFFALQAFLIFRTGRESQPLPQPLSLFETRSIPVTFDEIQNAKNFFRAPRDKILPEKPQTLIPVFFHQVLDLCPCLGIHKPPALYLFNHDNSHAATLPWRPM
jgi:hypothetical protein